MGEFDLIARYFAQPAARLWPNGTGLGASAGRAMGDAPQKATLDLGIGDDAALMRVAPDHQLVVSTDTMVVGRHFFPDVSPASLGHKLLATNLSDLAAMGATPLGFTLALTLPAVDEAWLQGFAEGLLALAAAHHCPLIGGDTTQGPLNVGVTILGQVPTGQALCRHGASAGDDLWVSGTPGDAHWGLQAMWGNLSLDDADMAYARDRLERPTPRLSLGLTLRGVASAAADVSDGLVGDALHIVRASARRSGVGLVAQWHAPAVLAAVSPRWRADIPTALRHALMGGDDYELVFTAPPSQRDAVLVAAEFVGVPVHRVGRLVASTMGSGGLHSQADDGTGRGLAPSSWQLLDAQGQPMALDLASFDHFA